MILAEPGQRGGLLTIRMSRPWWSVIPAPRSALDAPGCAARDVVIAEAACLPL